ncbi:UDP-N-acetylglucosamine 4,6-dehydratase [Treponema endosymbiont of Eucomonympha sp.]|uniref:UDP-N-acetylglucosamine 4,6-dehydratase n=1 Tax=Treponema endosymbiont of Eucomonympha sp. TaxID=1580831 RepID=UPI0007512C9F|nr:UDP-N-acetylglucosamine 4,6-dehydratase [Treponema endosymbiont of Eucomonympha sp.]
MENILSLIGRNAPLFTYDIDIHESDLQVLVASSRFLVIGGAGSIGAAVVCEIFKRGPKLLHIVDINENNLAECVRDVRSSLGYITGEFATFAIDCGSDIFDSFISSGSGYDYVFNLSALKHVRSEKDPFTLMRMIDTNIFNTDKTIKQAKVKGVKKYFCVSTDKAANPVSMMGASKRIMEMFLMQRSLELPISTARFANVAFSDGSLLYGFNQRMEKEQPLAAPNDVRRYFVTQQEAGELCLMSCLLGENRDIFFPKLDCNLNLIAFSEIAERYLKNMGYEPVQCATEDEARQKVLELKAKKQYPVYFFKSDTTGEKGFEEFYTKYEILDMNRFKEIGIIKKEVYCNEERLCFFIETIHKKRQKKTWTRAELVDLFNEMIPDFNHKETGKFLDEKM